MPYAVADVLPTLTISGPVGGTSIGPGTNAIYAEDSIQPSDVVTLIKDISLVHRPAAIAAENHLLLDMDDIIDPLDGYVAPAEEHIGDLLRFFQTGNVRNYALMFFLGVIVFIWVFA